jgi:preprotein translocase subunit SecB|tara:strand:+ start:968 stop:1414 length:447 start_codon:yes stop_codon:yes gene_type:complete
MPSDVLTASPLQLKQLLFVRVHVEAENSEKFPDGIWAPEFDFAGVRLGHHIDVTPAEKLENGRFQYVIAVIFQVFNEDAESQACPYILDIEARALFEMRPMENEEKRDSLVRVNGASMVIGAIREQVTLLTSRCLYGPLTLPSFRVEP